MKCCSLAVCLMLSVLVSGGLFAYDRAAYPNLPAIDGIPRSLFVGYRGETVEEPENTARAVRFSVSRGFPVAVDALLTADGELIASADESYRERDWRDDLERFDAGTLAPEGWPNNFVNCGYRLAKLSEIFAELEPGMKLVIRPLGDRGEIVKRLNGYDYEFVDAIEPVEDPVKAAALVKAGAKRIYTKGPALLYTRLEGYLAKDRLLPKLDRRRLLAHAGAREEAPENTLAAFRCMQRGGFSVECDLAMTKDGVPFMSHDYWMNRPGSGIHDKLRSDVNWKGELEHADFGWWMGERWKGERPCTLEQFLDTIDNGRSVVFHMQSDTDPVFEAIRDGLAKRPWIKEENILFLGDARRVRKFFAKARVGGCPLPRRGWMQHDPPHDVMRWANGPKTAEPTRLFAPRWDNELITKEFVDALHATGQTVDVWAIDDPYVVLAAFNRGVDFVCTDRPKSVWAEIHGEQEFRGAKYQGVADGVLDENRWQEVDWRKAGTAEYALIPGSYDLTLGVKFTGANAAKDVFEFCFSPTQDENEYYRFTFGPGLAEPRAEYFSKAGANRLVPYSPEWKARVKPCADGGYSAEAWIDLSCTIRTRQEDWKTAWLLSGALKGADGRAKPAFYLRDGLTYRPRKFGGWVMMPEKEYDFVAREFETVHRGDLRDPALKPAKDEFVFTDGLAVGDADFADYLRVSMGVKAEASSGPAVRTALDPAMKDREYTIEVTADGIAITARNERARRDAFCHLEDLMNLRRAPFLKFGTERRRPKFARRINRSGLGGLDYSDNYLELLVHHGFDTITLGVAKRDLEKRNERMDDVIRRAAAHGIDVYLYAHLGDSQCHPDDPGCEAELDATYGRAVAVYPETKGMILVGESLNYPSKDPHSFGRKGGRYFGTDYPAWLAAVERSVRKVKPDYDLIYWTYNFMWYECYEGRTPYEVIRNISTNTSILVTFVNDPFRRDVKRNGLAVTREDYTISSPGPSPIFEGEAMVAHLSGHRLYSQVNTAGRTWDFGTAPYEPFPQQWKRRWDAIGRAQELWGLSALLETHHFGWSQNFVTELAKEAFTEGGMPFEAHLRAIAARDFGEAHADEVTALWNEASEAVNDYVAMGENQYTFFRIGPAYPFNFLGEPFQYNEFPGYDSGICNVNFGYRLTYDCDVVGKGAKRTFEPITIPEDRLAKEGELFRGGGERMVRVGRRLRALAGELPGGERRNRAMRQAGLMEYLGRSMLNGANIVEGQLHFQRYNAAADPETKAAEKAEIYRLAALEYENTLRTVPLLEEDSQLGYEASMKYKGGLKPLLFKLKRMEELYGL